VQLGVIKGELILIFKTVTKVDKCEKYGPSGNAWDRQANYRQLSVGF
jgi:hypothetical protein